jgi:hypothetical protein
MIAHAWPVQDFGPTVGAYRIWQLRHQFTRFDASPVEAASAGRFSGGPYDAS